MKFTKHIHVLHLLSQIPAPSRKKPENYYLTSPVTQQEAIDCWDHLFHYIHTHWASPLTAAETRELEWKNRFTVGEKEEIVDCQRMLEMSTKELEEKLATLPPYFTESLFPVAIARYLLRDLCLPINHRGCKTFAEFHSRYGTMISAD